MEFQDPTMQGSYYVWGMLGVKEIQTEGWMGGRTDR